MRAELLIRDQPHYRRYAFESGLKRLGYTIGPIVDPTPNDVFVSWNLYSGRKTRANQFKAAGAKVLVAENGYYGKDNEDRQYYALARDGHNGSGKWYTGDEDRLSHFNIYFKAWREEGKYILVCPQRGIGPPDFAMPKSWPDEIVAQLKKMTTLPIKLRPHPGNKPAEIPLSEDLKDAARLVVWSSNSSIAALIEGIPTYFCAPHIVTEGACLSFNNHQGVERSVFNDGRTSAFHRMSWAQWSVEELENGFPFEYLLKEVK